MLSIRVLCVNGNWHLLQCCQTKRNISLLTLPRTLASHQMQVTIVRIIWRIFEEERKNPWIYISGRLYSLQGDPYNKRTITDSSVTSFHLTSQIMSVNKKYDQIPAEK